MKYHLDLVPTILSMPLGPSDCDRSTYTQISPVLLLEPTVRIASATAAICEYLLNIFEAERHTSCCHDICISYGHRLLLVLASPLAETGSRHTLTHLEGIVAGI